MSHNTRNGMELSVNNSRIHASLIALAALSTSLVVGCGNVESPTESIGKTHEAVTATSKVVVNQYGYVNGLNKIAAVVDPTCAGKTFTVKNSAGTAVCSGNQCGQNGTSACTTSAAVADAGSGETVCKADFTGCNPTVGTGFTVDVTGVGTSDGFAIVAKGKDLYPTDMFDDAIYYFTYHRVGTQNVNISLSGAATGTTVTRNWKLRSNVMLGAFGNWTTGTFNVDGGQADAGDFGIYPDNAVQAMWVLGNLQELKRPGVTLLKSPDTTQDLLSEIIYGAKFLKGVLPADTTKLAAHKCHDADWYPQQPWGTSDGGTSTYIAGGDYTGAGRACLGPSSTATYSVARGLAQLVRIAGGRLNSVTMGGVAQSESGFWAAAQDAWARVQGRDSEVWNPYSVAEAGPAPAGNPYSMGFATGGGPYNDTYALDDKFSAAVEMFLTAKARGESYATYLNVVNSTATNCRINGHPEGVAARCLGLIKRRYFDWESDYVQGNLSLLAYHLSRGGSCTSTACTGGIAADVPDLYLVRNAIVSEADDIVNTIAANGYPVPLVGNDFPWGSNKVVMHSALIAAYAHILTSDPKYQKAVYQSMDYILGQNTLRLSMITGYGTRYDIATHDRQADGTAALSANGTATSPKGWLTGGSINGMEVNDYWPGHPGFNGNPPQWAWDGVGCDKRFTRNYCLGSYGAVTASGCPSPLPALANWPDLPACPAGTAVQTAGGQPVRVDCCAYPETPRPATTGTTTLTVQPNYAATNFAVNELPGTAWDCYLMGGAGCTGAKPPRQPHRWSWCSEENTIDWNAPFAWTTWYIRGGCESNADCNDSNACTTDTCNTATGFCTHAAANEGTACDDSNACTSTDVCTNGSCKGTANAAACADDGSACTSDVCSAGACTHPVLTSCSGGTGLTGKYYNGMTLSGTPVLTRTDAKVDFNWAAGVPSGTTLPVDGWSVSWTGTIKPLYSQTYTFYETSDDGGRLKIWSGTEPGTYVINGWADGAAETLSGTIALTAGTTYNIKYEFYENAGDASAKLEWSSSSQAREVIPQAQLFPSQTGTCTPLTDPQICTANTKNCGTITADDGCGSTRTVTSCGSCTAPQTCGGGGVQNVCGGGCTPTTCAALNATCGSPSDGCGGTLTCGSCSTGLSCSTSFQCVSTGGANGSACTAGNQCTSGNCVDGVCCNTACSGGTTDCQACNVTGFVGTCHALPAATSCRGAAGECDLAEVCDGTNTACPADGKKVAGTACTADTNPCTQDKCDGTANTCTHPAGNAGQVCRQANGACDVAENCDGVSTTCPADGFAPTTTPCRAAAGECDIAEMCPGNSATCGTDVVKAVNTACTDDGKVCTTDKCNGTSGLCQHAAGNAGTTCRNANGVCDVAETCNGTLPDCPTDAFLGTSSSCRPAAGQCDAAEVCPGNSPNCPADSAVANGTTCNDGVSTNCNDVCTGGVCGGSVCCTAETDATFCTRLGKNCGTVSGADNCGTPRTVTSCGSCTSPATCGGAGTPNVCGTATTGNITLVNDPSNSTSYAYSSSSSQITKSYALATASNNGRLLVAAVAGKGNTAAEAETETVTFNGVAMTKAVSFYSNSAYSGIYYLKDAQLPASTGSYNLVVAGHTQAAQVDIYEYKNVDQTTPIDATGGAAISNSCSSTDPNQPITVVTANAVIVTNVAWFAGSSNNATPMTGVTETRDYVSNSLGLCVGYTGPQTTGLKNISWALTSCNNSTHTIIAIRPGGGGGGGPTCTDAVKNGTETDVDCGGSCTTKCANTKLCSVNADCVSVNCVGGVCQAAPTCTDAVKNGTETDVDCGGSCTTKCATGKFCSANADCASSICTGGVCQAAASCTDGVKNGSETDVDCGGSCSTKCVDGKVCAASADCQTSSCVSGICCAVLNAPGLPTVAAGDSSCSASWGSVSGAESYNLKRSTTSGSGYATVASPTSTSYLNSGLTNGTTYYYVVTAVNVCGAVSTESPNSVQVSGTPSVSCSTPAAPTSLTATAGNASVTLSWTASATAGVTYKVMRGTTSGSYPTTVATDLTGTTYVNNSGLTNDTPYYYVVVAVGCTTSSNSNQASATPTAGGTGCTEATATDIGGTGVETTVASNGCLKITPADFPGWWNPSVHRVRFGSTSVVDGLPTAVPFTFSTSCSANTAPTCTVTSGGAAVACSFTAMWQDRYTSSTVNNACAFIIDLTGGSGNTRVRWYNDP